MKHPDYGRYRHTMTYPDGTVIRGKMDHQHHIKWLGLTAEDVRGETVLDIAANDGFFAFWCEWNGASRVVATDVEDYEHHDWGPGGMPEEVRQIWQQDKADVFWEHHKATNSRIERYPLSLYDTTVEKIGGPFDIVFNFGLIYHLRAPRHGIDKTAELCRDLLFLETEIFPTHRKIPMVVDAGGRTGVLTPADYSIPTEAAVVHWLDYSGFPYVFFEAGKPKKRQRFVACRTEKWIDRLVAHPHLIHADEKYWESMRAAAETFKLRGFVI